MDIFIFMLVLLSIPLEAFHDWYRQSVVNAMTVYNNHADRKSKIIKGFMLLVVWFIGCWFEQTRPYAVLHICLRFVLVFDYFYELFRCGFDYKYFKVYGWKTVYKIIPEVWSNIEIKKQYLEICNWLRKKDSKGVI